VVIKDKLDMFQAVLKNKYKSLTSMPAFDPRILPADVSFNESEIEMFVVKLKTTLDVFGNEIIHKNEKQARVFIDIFLKNAICYARKCYPNEKISLAL
jgi:hypothetical protein